ncbi:SapC family protein [Ferrimonas balearica]|uniref:SapC family protein n=1 Tax=Ferrimonas balearica TaxID=44012 RepID=UPI001C995222|nr:SapC family protein [Ferrimonas balearica]MBY5921822.1 SapC family protein [Ferrimonas balearica]MBY5994838.1 SapC family protein [Ferrimonas balearica]
MEAQIVPLQKEKHANTKIKDDPGFAHVKDQHIVPVVVHEFVRASNDFPIVFVKNNESGQFRAVVMLGFKQGENYFAGSAWKGVYIPAAITHYPLALVPDMQNPGQLMVAVNEASDRVGDEEGHALFEAGEPSAFLERKKESLGRFIESDQITQAFVTKLNELELLENRTLNLKLQGDEYNIGGIYMVNEKALNELSDEAFGELRKRGFLPLVYAHLASLHQVNRLADKKING